MMKNTLLGAAISMMSTGAAMVALENFYGGWFIFLGTAAGFVSVLLHASKVDEE